MTTTSTTSTDDVQNYIKLIADKHTDALEACKQYIAAEKISNLNATGIYRLIDAYMAVASTDDVKYAINLVTDKHYKALEACKQYLASEKLSKFNLDATGIRNLLNACDIVHKLDAYNITAAAFVDKFSDKSSNDANVCKILYMIASEKNSAMIAAAEFFKLSTML
jgi:hypothetical protein